jgi:hypothetical protein
MHIFISYSLFFEKLLLNFSHYLGGARFARTKYTKTDIT